VHVNPGGGPDRDDTGLPPVDVEIPDDARELDRDVQAYRREQRARRRQLRGSRLRGTLSRDGMVMPLLICCLVFALITGTLLTFFTSTPIDPTGLQGSGTKPGGKPGGAATPGSPAAAPAQLASAPVEVAGHPHAVGALGPAILLVAPPNCGCRDTIAEIGNLASAAHESVYLVSAVPAAARSALPFGPAVRQATDVSRVLTGSDYTHAGLTAIMVTRSGVVSYEQQLQASTNLQDLIPFA
jgi:hypothetical protein